MSYINQHPYGPEHPNQTRKFVLQLRQGLDDKAKEMTFSAVVNAEVVKGAENYYRNMFFR